MFDLSKPAKGYWAGKGFGRHFIWVYKCDDCGKVHFMRASSFMGRTPVASVGGCYCGCEGAKEKTQAGS